MNVGNQMDVGNQMTFDPIGLRKAFTVTAFASACCLAAPTALAQNANLQTKTGNDVAVTVSGYKYNEPGVMQIKATKIGFDYTGTYAIGTEFPNRNNGWYVRGDARYATGKGDYSSGISGSINDRPDWYYEVRGLVGRDFHFSDYTLSPYAGLGYRHLFNDLRGLSSTGAAGYRRESHYTTLPLGVTHKMNLGSQARLVTTVEYSHLIRGRQESKFSDTVGSNGIIAAQDAENRQRHGYGVRLGVSYQTDQWSVGPFVHYWNIKESDTVSVSRSVVGPVTLRVFEPANKTTEFGVKAAYQF